MADTAYTTDVHGPLVATGSYASLIVSDGTNKHSIRTFSCVNTDSSARTIFISFGAGAAATEIVEKSIPANDCIHINGLWVIPTSTVVQIKASVTGVVSVTASGYHVT
jgi:hypothetical protein